MSQLYTFGDILGILKYNLINGREYLVTYIIHAEQLFNIAKDSKF